MARPKDTSAPAALKGGKRDLTTGPIGATLIAFALPVMGSNILQSLNGSANAIWVSHVLGEAALTATSNANQILFLMLGAVFGISMAANLMIGQAVGAEDAPTTRKVVGTSTTFFICLSLAVGLIGFTLTPHILAAMGTPLDARPDAIAYLRVIFAAMPFMYFFSFVMMAQRGVGDSRTPFYFALMAVGMDVILNPLLITGYGPFPEWGITGAAASTLISQTITLGAMIALLYVRKSPLVLKPSEWRMLIPDMGIVRALVFKGLPMGVQMMVVSLAAVSMMTMVNAYGSHTAAGYGAALQVWTYVQMPAMALGAAVSSMAAQNVGAGRMDRVEKLARIGVLYSMLFSGIPILLIYLGEYWVLRAFLPGESASLPIAMHINAVVLWGFVPFGIAFIYSGIVRSTGAVWPPLLAMVVALWGVRVPFAHFLGPVMGSDAIWWSFPLGSIVTASLGYAYYRWGGWRKARLIQTSAPVAPHGDAPDTGMAPPGGVEESEVCEEVRRLGSAAPNKPASEAPA